VPATNHNHPSSSCAASNPNILRLLKQGYQPQPTMATDMSWFFASATQAPPPTSNVFTAASRGDVASLSGYIENGEEDVPVNGWRAIHSAAAKGHLECLQLLHQRKYNGDSVHTGILSPLTSSGDNVLHLAAGRGKVEVCEYILQQTGVDCIRIRNAQGYTSIHLAAHNGHEAIVKLLVGYGDDAGVVTDEGVSPILLAASAGQIATFDYLVSLDGGRHLDAVSSTGLTPLHKASSGGHEDIVKKCLNSNKILVDAESDSGGTSLHAASQNGYLGTVLLLIKAGADVCKKNGTGQTPLHKVCSFLYIYTSSLMIKLLDCSNIFICIFKHNFFTFHHIYFRLPLKVISMLSTPSSIPKPT
jgi:ankyrin repeat protein